jgi:hypothetical protein
VYIDDPDDPGAVIAEKHGGQRSGRTAGEVKYCDAI